MLRHLEPRAAVMASAVLAMAAAVAHAEFRLPESEGQQSQPAVATHRSGGFVVVWREHFPDAAQPLNTIRMQRFDAAGAPAGGNQRVDILPGDNARNPVVDVAADGSFVIVWEGGAAEGPIRRTIWARRFNRDGTPRGKELRINLDRLHTQTFGVADQRFGTPAVSIAPDRSFVIVWRDDGGAHCYRAGISARRFGADGKPRGQVIRVNTLLRDAHLYPVVGHDAAGGFVIAWQHSTLLGTRDERSDIRARRFDAKGKPTGDVIAVRAGIDHAITPSLAVNPDGSFAVAWLEREYDGLEPEILARGFSADGTPGPLAEVASEHLNDKSHPTLVRSGFGYTVYWAGSSADPWVGTRIWRRGFGAGGEPVGSARTIGPGTCRRRAWPDAGPLPDGAEIAVWEVGRLHVIEGLRRDQRGSELATSSLAPAVDDRWPALLPTEERFPNAGDRAAAARKLGCFRFEAAAASGLLAGVAANDRDHTVRAIALFDRALVTPDPTTVLPALLEAARSGSPTEQIAASRGLGVIGLADGVGPVIGILENAGVPPVRAAAAKALGHIGLRPTGGSTTLGKIRGALEQALRIEVGDCRDEERPMLCDREAEVRKAAAAALARLPDSRYGTLTLIFNALLDDHPVFALDLCATINQKNYSDSRLVTPRLDDARTEVRTAAVRCLARQGRTAPTALTDPSPEVRGAAADAIRELGQKALLDAGGELEQAARNETNADAEAPIDAAWLALQDAICSDTVVKRTPTPTPRPRPTLAPLPPSPMFRYSVSITSDQSFVLTPRSAEEARTAAGPDCVTVWGRPQISPEAAARRLEELRTMSQAELEAIVESHVASWREMVKRADRKLGSPAPWGDVRSVPTPTPASH